MTTTLKTLSRRLRIPFNRRYAFRRLADYHARPRSLEETVDWAMRFGGGGYYTVKTLQIPKEITALARSVEALRPKVILEIGTARGGTLLIWSRLASEEVISCDLNDMRVQGELYRAFPSPGSKCKVTLLSGNSHEPAFKQRVAAALAGRRADFLFIDGDHTEGGVSADFNDYKEFVRPGGIIAFHDIVENQPLPTNQVYHLWKRIKDEYPSEEFVNDRMQCGFGIGIIRLPDNSR
jgi:cephalosporin hydroxylase